MLRIALFLGTNLAVVLVFGIALHLLGIDTFVGDGSISSLLGPLLICFCFGMGGSLLSLLLSKRIAISATHARIINNPVNNIERRLLAVMRDLSLKAGITTPQFAIFPSSEPNAFATGFRQNSSLVAVSQGLLDRLTPDEVDAVIGHEIGHIANKDMITMGLLQGVLNTFVLFFARMIGYTIDRFIFKSESGYGIGFFFVTIVTQVLLGFLASVIVLWFSRYREFRADNLGARFAGRENLIAALARLRTLQDLPNTLPDSLVAMGIRESSASIWRRLLSSHPPLEMRIAALKKRTI